MAAIEGVAHAREVGTDGRARPIDLAAFEAPCAGWRLVLLGRDSLEARNWLVERSGLSSNAVAAMLEDDVRPRAVAMEGGVMLVLRGPTLDPGGKLAAMTSLRLFVTAARLVGVERRTLPAFEKRVAALDAGEGTAGVGAFLAGLVAAMRRDVEPVLDRLERALDGFELGALERDRPPTAAERRRLNAARHDAILMRRHLAPQAEAIRALIALAPDWLSDPVIVEGLQVEADAFRRIAEDLEAVRQRATIVSDEAALRVGEETNRLILRLSIVSLVFLPLTFATGLLGVNLAGIPFADSDWAFGAFAITLIGVGALLLALLRRAGLL
jgi:zinc transporter